MGVLNHIKEKLSWNTNFELGKPIILEVLEPRILLSANSLLIIAPDPLQDTILDNTHQVAQYAELLDTNEQIEEQISQEPTPSDTPNTDVCRPIFSLFVDDDNTNDELVDADLGVDNIGSAQINGDIAVLSYNSDGDIECEVGTTKDDSSPVYVNNNDISIEENRSIEIRGSPASQTVTLFGMHLVDSNIDYFDGQIIYLDFDGEQDVTYDGPLTIDGIDVPASSLPGDLAGQEDTVIAHVLEDLERIFAGSGVVFITEKPAPSQAYSTIYIGGDDSDFADYGSFFGLAEQVDVGNQTISPNRFRSKNCWLG